MTDLRIGPAMRRLAEVSLADGVGFVELDLRAPLPRVATIARWAKSLPPNLQTSLVIPPSATRSAEGPLRIDDFVSASLSWTSEVARNLEVATLVLVTPPDVSPSQRSRDLIAAFVERLPRAAPIVWVASGVWEADTAAAFAKKLGVYCAVDPLGSFPASELIYGRLEAAGYRSRLNDSVLDQAIGALTATEPDRAYLAIRSERALHDARRAARLSVSAP